MNDHQHGRDRQDLPGGPGTPLGESDLDEAALRRLLHDVVEEIEPAPDTLDQLRCAVPARRARRRQARIGAAAAVLLVGTAVPALVHVAQSGGAADDQRAITAADRRTHGGPGTGHDSGQDAGTGVLTPTGLATVGGGQREGGGKAGTSRPPGAGPGGSAADPSGTMAATSPTCTRAQLGTPSASTQEADTDGKVYGSFRLVNISDSDCTVDGRGSVFADAKGSADSDRIQVVDHTAGDAATQLPDPSREQEQLILKHGQAYEVKFAFAPASGGPGGCPAPESSPDPASSGGSVDSSDSSEQPAQTPAATDEPATEPAGSVVLRHIPQAGDPMAADTTIPNVCAGTIYRTGVLSP